jgi:hypothetical protein
MKLRPERLRMLVLAVSVLVISSGVWYSVSQVFDMQARGQASVIQGTGGGTSDLGQSIKDLTQGIIAGTNEQVQNTLESAGNQALPQLQQNASSYDCLIIVMNFGKAHGAMTCSPNQSISTGITVNSANAPTGSVQSSIQRQGSNTLMQNSMQGSGSSANVIPGNVP